MHEHLIIFRTVLVFACKYNSLRNLWDKVTLFYRTRSMSDAHYLSACDRGQHEIKVAPDLYLPWIHDMECSDMFYDL